MTALQVCGADGLATMMIAASEGAVVLARAQQALAPLETVHRQLRRLAETYGPDQDRDDQERDDRDRDD